MGLFDKDSKRSFLALSQSFGRGEAGISVLVTKLTGQFKLGASTTFQIQLPYQVNAGEWTTTAGMSDPVFTLSHDLGKFSAARFNLNLGFKIPAGSANLELDGVPLPMPYQVSLGTYDLMLGFAFSYNRFLASIGFQQPLNANRNQYTGQPLGTVVFDNTRNFMRRPDLTIRVAQGFEWKKFVISAGVLPILHLGNDTFESDEMERVEIKGSAGLTLNLNGSVAYQLPGSLLLLDLAAPVIVRTARPDGLTRSFLMALTWRWYLSE
jgi:hypothetical protein